MNAPGSSTRHAILLSGPTSGLGLELLKQLVQYELTLLLIGRDLERVASQLCATATKHYAIECDLASLANASVAESLSRRVASYLIEAAPSCITFVSNAGVVSPIGLVGGGGYGPGEFMDATAVNFIAPVAITSACAAYARVNKASLRVVNISSGAATRAYSGWSAYCSTKAAARMYFDVLAAEPDLQAAVRHWDPGVLDTSMQEIIRSANDNEFPQRDYFRQLKLSGELKPAAAAAEQITRMILSREIV